ncbi:ABC transporter substrate-binding protein [Actinomadura opuntiae]|uniref:ABC transporter substrate-binding protein n=1 Tax=Actinomadura sp. OS1-43 TaxID=604315 RepID=UPI00255ACFA7|nr:ABC transporter substrate-binding protein [Actinomadura sp. OS1-43]MDL4817306.1 ABC transporter substrate-binding protein [Actinomadura sp. OS1-43]
MRHPRRLRTSLLRPVALLCAAATALSGCTFRWNAQAGAGRGDIVIGASLALSGPLAVTGVVGSGAQAYFSRVNAEGGVNGRKIDFQVLDDAYDASRLTANMRRLVEQEHAALVLSFGGAAISTRPYLGERKVPLIALAGQTPFSDVRSFPYARAWWPDIAVEGKIAGTFLKNRFPGAKAGLLGLNNDLTPSQANGLRAAGLALTKTIKVAPSVVDLGPQVNELRGAGVDVLFLSVGGAAQSAVLRLMDQVGYHPKIMLYSAQSEYTGTLTPAGPAAKGVYTAQWAKDPSDPRWAADPAVRQFKTDMARYGHAADSGKLLALNGYGAAAAVVAALRKAPALDGKGFLKGWDGLHGTADPALLPGMSLDGGSDGRLVRSYRVQQFDGRTWHFEDAS